MVEKSRDSFVWHPQKEAEQLLKQTVLAAVEKNQFLLQLQQELQDYTSTRLFDWIDHIELGYSDALHKELVAYGFESKIATPNYRVFLHPGAKLPLMVVKDQSHPFVGISLAVESISDFLMVRGMTSCIEGSFLSGYRRASVSKEQGVFVYVVERRGILSMEPTMYLQVETDKILTAYEQWQTRPRAYDDEYEEEEGLRLALTLAEEMVEKIGSGMAAAIVLDVERRYWQSKNKAAQIQKNRQDRLGLGWANHDHHTFRSSRRHFRVLVRLFEILGFHCRERFYAGDEAGWGAQVMEHTEGRFVVFLDVDLSPSEVDIDFAHHPLEERSGLGTIGLWCALHGESILKAGMHHLEAQFNFDKFSDDLKQEGITVMAPFTNLDYLRQAFTAGEQWSVAPHRIQKLLERGQITQEQAGRFSTKGAIGSHLENLERKEGYKGFHQKSVSDIIHRTDPRGA